MFTKIYEKIKTFIKENYKGLILIIGLFLLFNYELPYSIYTPGGTIDLNDRIEVDGKHSNKGSINLTYVSMVKGTLPMLGLAKVLPTWDIVSNDDLTMDDESIKETFKRDQYYMQEAISNATYVAFKSASKDIKITETKSIVTYISDEAKTDLKLYDGIKSYDGIKFTSFATLKNYVGTKKIGESIKFTIIRNNKETTASAEIINLDNSSKIGIMTSTINEYNTNPKISVKTKSSESGPSGGLMTTLAIYNAIIDKDITQSRIIAGTGTIDIDGNVGEIGGVTYKVAGAEKRGAKIFFCPKENYEEALKFTQDNDYDIIVVSVGTFSEALTYLERENINE